LTTINRSVTLVFQGFYKGLGMAKGRKYIAYYRVSTQKQGASGLGLDGQRNAVEAHIASNPGTLVGQYTEIESGKNSARPEIAKAIAHAKRSKAQIVVAKLDRLARNVAFTSALMESGADFCACDNPNANKLTIHILAAVAENEAEQISQRTKAALEAAKQRGVKLGSHRPGHWDGREEKRLKGLEKARRVAAEIKQRSFNAAYEDLFPVVEKLREEGHSLQLIADKLNEIGHTTRRDKPWNRMQVSRLLNRRQ